MSRLQAATDTFAEVVSIYVALLLVAAGVFFFAEGTSLADALYWAGTTATSTGYGDLSPKTIVGKLDAFFLMHASIFFIAPMVVVRMIGKLNVDRDAYTHQEQQHVLDQLGEIKDIVAGHPSVARFEALQVAANRLEKDMRRYIFDKDHGRRAVCLDAYRSRLGLGPWRQEEA